MKNFEYNHSREILGVEPDDDRETIKRAFIK
jgi:curved DNA-binding protein CbpA